MRLVTLWLVPREATGSSDDEPVRKKPVPKAKAPKYEEIDDASDDGETRSA